MPLTSRRSKSRRGSNDDGFIVRDEVETEIFDICKPDPPAIIG
jgi:hypothetical protein